MIVDQLIYLEAPLYTGHIAIDARNPTLLATKRQAAGAFTGNSMALVPYKPLSVEEKETSLG